MKAIRYTFTKNERLKREQQIDTLFRKGKAFSVFPIRIVYHLVPREAGAAPVGVGFSVPKKRFKTAVKRNLVRRKLVEAWRLNKHILYPAVPEVLQLHLFLIFVDNTPPNMQTATQAIVKGIEKLKTEIQESDS